MASWDEEVCGWIVSRHVEAAAVLRDAVTFTVDDPRFSTALVVGPSMLSSDGAAHARQRQAFQPLFTKRRAAGAGRVVAGVVARHLAAMPVDGEWRTGFAAPVAVDVMADLFGLSAEAEVVLGWYRTIVDAVSRSGSNTSAADGAFRLLTEEILASPVVSQLLSTDPSVTSAEVASNTAVALFGGIETVEGTIASAIYRLFASTECRDALAADPALIEPFVEEVLRLEPAAAVVHRYATLDCHIGGVSIKRGDFVVVSILEANRDGDVFEDPGELRLDRPNGRAHLSFAVGPHGCPGLHLARLEARIAVEHVLSAKVDHVLDSSRSSPPAGDVFRKPHRVYLAPEPASGRSGAP